MNIFDKDFGNVNIIMGIKNTRVESHCVRILKIARRGVLKRRKTFSKHP